MYKQLLKNWNEHNAIALQAGHNVSSCISIVGHFKGFFHGVPLLCAVAGIFPPGIKIIPTVNAVQTLVALEKRETCAKLFSNTPGAFAAAGFKGALTLGLQEVLNGSCKPI